MQLKYNRQPKIGNTLFKILVKLILVIVVLIFAIFLIEKVKFPSPEKKFKIDGYIGKVAIKNFDDPTGQGEGSSVVAKKESLKNFQFKCENKFNDRIIQAKYDDKLNHLFYVDGKTYTPAIEGIQNGKAKILAKSDRFIIFQIRTDYFVGNRVLDIKKKQVLSLKGTSTEKKRCNKFF